MYINRIDDLLDKIIDDFYINIISKDEIILHIIDEINFVKYQKEINQLLIKYIKTINIEELRELVKNEDIVQLIVNIIKRYIALYLFLTLGVFYKGNEDTFINNIVEFTKNQFQYGFKVDNFFNSENNAIIIQYYKLISNIITVVNADPNKITNYLQKNEFKEAINILNNLGQDYVDNVFKIKNLHDQAHNIIKTILVLYIYKKVDKENIIKILETIENADGEFIFIDIVIPKKQHINFSTIENLLSKKDLLKGIAYEIWDFILDQEDNIRLSNINSDDKIMKLLNSKLVIPIVEDFLMYHKDNEIYDRITNDLTNIKRKEDTKIRYIVTKIDRISEYHSDTVEKDPTLKEAIKRLFYMPLYNRKVVLYNDIEDIKIINKIQNQGSRSIENNEYYNDLINYRKYPYINFKEIKGYGFSITLDKQITLLRSTNLVHESQLKDTKSIELRIGSNDQTINIVGLVIPTNVREFECLKVKDFISIKDQPEQNGYHLFYKYLQQSNLNTKHHKSSIYWLFNLETDTITMNTYEQFNKLNNQEQVRYLMTQLYDDLLYEVFYQLTKIFDLYKTLPLYTAFRLIEDVESNTLELLKDSELLNRLEEKIYYEKYEKIEPGYDENEDKFYGLYGNVIPLERIPNKIPPIIQIVKIDIGKIIQKERTVEFEKVSGICQHIITWDNIYNLRKENPNKYTDLLYAFIEQYVVENDEHEYICRSCSYQLNIKKYVIDGIYDDDTERFIQFSTPMEVPLEDIAEYQKYLIAIRNIDKLIERIGTISNMSSYMGSASNIKWQRMSVTKNTIDIILLHNDIMKKNFRERNMMATKLYGINRELSNFFIFDLDNSIFIYSSKEKDYFKNVKHNNVICYIMILMILELNNSQITFITGDKKDICNFAIYEKFGNILFEGLKIRKNKGGDLVELRQYPVLCYLLYILSCMVTRYNLWFYEYSTTGNKDNIKAPVSKSKKRKFDPKIQKIIIQTIIDILNSLLEISAQKNMNRLYEMIATKYYRKLTETFNNVNILHVFTTNVKSSISLERKDFLFKRISNIPLTGKFIKMTYGMSHYRKCLASKYFVQPRNNYFKHYYEINNITNCPSGDFHSWKILQNKFVCIRCGTSIDTTYNEKLTDQIRKEFHYITLQELARKYCRDYINNEDQKCSVCEKCKVENYQFTHQELDEFEEYINKYKKTNQIKINHQHENKHEEYEKQVLNKLFEHYKRDNTTDSPFKFIDKFINNIEEVLGTDTNIKNATILLKDNIYIIDHDHLGYPLDKPLIIADINNRISFKRNHPFYKTDVIYYSNYKLGRLDVFYDAITHILLGYKENNKEFVLLNKMNKKIKINYSFANKLKLLGYPSQYINIGKMYEDKERDIIDMGSDNIDKEMILHNIMTEIIRNRIFNLKRVIYQFQRYIWRIITTTSIKIQLERLDKPRASNNNFDQEQIDPFTTLLNQYQKKISNIRIEDNQGKHKLFKHWKAIINNLFAESLEDKTIVNERLYNAQDISRYDMNGNVLLYYIITEIDNLLKFNQDKFIKTNIAMFIIDFINLLFNTFNIEQLYDNFDIKRFIYIISSKGYVYDIDEAKGYGMGDTQGIYLEYLDPNHIETEDKMDEEYDAQEEQQSLDVDMKYDDILDYYTQIDDWTPELNETIEG